MIIVALLVHALHLFPYVQSSRLYVPPSLAENASIFLWTTGGNETGCHDIVQLARDKGYFSEGEGDCGYYGNWTDTLHQTPAFEGCYECGGGIRNNSLTNKTITVGIPRLRMFYTYSRYTNSSGQPDGSVLRFVTDMADQYGLGVKEIEMDMDFDTCLSLLLDNTLDLCLGPFWTTKSRASVVDFSMPFYTEDFYLISRIDEDNMNFVQAMFNNPTRPFSFKLWMFFVFTLSFVGFGNFLVRLSPREHSNKLKGNIFQKVWKTLLLFVKEFSVSMRQCLKGEAFEVREKTSISEHIIIFGLVTFSVLFITGYGANYTAGLINNTKEPEYKSLSEAIEKNATICIPPQIEDELTFLYPELSNYKLSGTIPMEVRNDDGICDAGIISSLVFEQFVTAEFDGYTVEETCKGMVMIYEENPIIILADALALSRHFISTDIGREFVKTINFYIGSYVYRVNYDNVYYKKFRDAGFKLEEVNKASNGNGERSMRYQSELSTRLQISGTVEHICNSEHKPLVVGEPFEASVLLFPIVFSCLCTTVAIGIWIMKLLEERKRINAFKSSRKSVRGSLASIENFSTTYVEDEILFHEREFDKMSIYKVIKELNRLLVDNGVIEAALEKLPNKDHLRRLYVENKVSDMGKVYSLLSKLSILQLCSILEGDEKNYSETEGDSEWTSFLEENDPKRKLIAKILAAPESRDRAIGIIYPDSFSNDRQDFDENVELSESIFASLSIETRKYWREE